MYFVSGIALIRYSCRSSFPMQSWRWRRAFSDGFASVMITSQLVAVSEVDPLERSIAPQVPIRKQAFNDSDWSMRAGAAQIAASRNERVWRFRLVLLFEDSNPRSAIASPLHSCASAFPRPSLRPDVQKLHLVDGIWSTTRSSINSWDQIQLPPVGKLEDSFSTSS
jgi:hypothetical protein